MNAIKIEVVAIGGRLVGRTASDRHNLAMLGLVDLVDDGRNGGSLKRARRLLSREFGDAFVLAKSRRLVLSTPSEAEVEAMGKVLAGSYSVAA